MKKTLVALAALAATGTYAQSVMIDGIMDANYTNAKAYGQNYSLIDQSGARTTTFKFTGVEDVGGGTKVKFRMEAQPLIIAGNGNAYNTSGSSASAGTVVANGTSQTTGQASVQSGLVGKGYSYVGTEGEFGEVQLGTINTASLAAHATGSGKFNTGIGSGYKHSIFADTTRIENSVSYWTPRISGLQARYLVGTSNDSQYGTTTAIVLRRAAVNEMGLDYANGPMQVTYAILKSKTSPNEAAATASGAAASNVTTTTNTLGVSYAIGDAKIGYVNQAQKNNAGADTDSVNRALSTSASMLFAQYQMGASRYMLSSGSRKTNSGYATVTTTDTNLAGLKGTYTGYAVEYDLSKRTYVYFRGQSQTVSDLAFTTVVVNGATLTAMPTDKKITVNALGISHQF